MSTKVIQSGVATADPKVAAMSDGLRIVAVTPQWLQEWQSLEERLQSDFITSSATWTQTWLRHYGDLVPHRMAVLSQGDHVRGMCLLTNGVTQHDGPFSIKTLHVGTAGEPENDSVCVEYNRLLTAPADRSRFASQLIKTVQERESAECFVLDGMEQNDALAFSEYSTPTEVKEVPSHYTDLNKIRAAPSEPWRLFGESTRTNLRRSLRDLGEVEFDWSETAEQALEYYDEMIGYHQQRWTASGKPGVFSSSRFREFHRDLITALVPRQRAVLVRARQQSRVLGILYLLIEDRRLLYYQAGLPEHQSKLSLGNVTQYLTMLEGARRGYEAFDFMAGDAQYKRVLSTDRNTVVWAKWRKSSLKFTILDGLRSIKERLRALS